MELHELHVLQRQAGAQHHAAAVAGAGVGAGAGEIGAAIAAGGQDHGLGLEAVQGAVVQLPGGDAPADAFVHDQVEGEVLDEELDVLASAWPYMVCSMAWPVRSAAAQVRWIGASPKLRVMPPKARW